jgi:hypothetical protein
MRAAAIISAIAASLSAMNRVSSRLAAIASVAPRKSGSE